jgi:hypothetical protein
MFFVTAHMVKPINGDELPNMRGMDGLKGNSPLVLSRRAKASRARAGYKISGQNEQTPAAAPAKVEETEDQEVDTTTQSSTSRLSEQRAHNNTALPVAKAVKVDFNPETVRPW